MSVEVPPKILLLQARLPDDPMAAHEHQCFVDKAGLPAENIVCYDLCQGPPSAGELAKFDAMTVGGAGDFYVSRGDLPHFEAFLDFLRETVEQSFPTFASCFGYQCMMQALGGEIIYDPDNVEVGTYDITLTDDGAADELLGQLPRHFRAQLGHKDRAVSTPDGVLNLAGSELSPFQALRVTGRPVWAAQFHPELDRQTNLDRYKYYLEGYAVSLDEAELQKQFDAFDHSPETDTLMPRFLSLVFDWPPAGG